MILTMDMALELSEHLKKELGITIHRKEDSDVMKTVATGMDIAGSVIDGVPASRDFMTRYATTLGKDVYLPDLIRNNVFSLIEVLPHEGQHAVRYEENGVEFAWLYLTEAAERAQEESDAYATGMAVKSWLTGAPPTNGQMQWVLDALVRGYHLKAGDASYAGKAILSHIQSIQDGIYMTHSARVSTAFLGSKYPGLKGSIQAW